MTKLAKLLGVSEYGMACSKRAKQEYELYKCILQFKQRCTADSRLGSAAPGSHLRCQKFYSVTTEFVWAFQCIADLWPSTAIPKQLCRHHSTGSSIADRDSKLQQ